MGRLVAELALIYSALALLVILGHFVYIMLAENIDARRIATSSMEPDFPIGSVVLIKRVHVDEVAVGDVVSYSYPQAPRYVLLHRVVGVDQDRVTVRGDATSVEEVVAKSNIRGVYVLGIPYVGLVGEASLADPLFTYLVILSILVILALTP